MNSQRRALPFGDHQPDDLLSALDSRTGDQHGQGRQDERGGQQPDQDTMTANAGS